MKLFCALIAIFAISSQVAVAVNYTQQDVEEGLDAILNSPLLSDQARNHAANTLMNNHLPIDHRIDAAMEAFQDGIKAAVMEKHEFTDAEKRELVNIIDNHSEPLEWRLRTFANRLRILTSEAHLRSMYSRAFDHSDHLRSQRLEETGLGQESSARRYRSVFLNRGYHSNEFDNYSHYYLPQSQLQTVISNAPSQTTQQPNTERINGRIAYERLGRNYQIDADRVESNIAQEPCMICLEDPGQCSAFYKTRCSHFVCESCLRGYAESRRHNSDPLQCPMCRANIERAV